MPGLTGERPLRPSRLEFLRRHVAGKTFISPSWAVVVDTTTGLRYRANGQHSSTVLAELAPEHFPANLLVVIQTFTTDDLAADGFAIFDLFDNPKAARSNTDVMGLYQAHYPDLIGIDTHLVVNVCAGIAFEEESRQAGVVWTARQRGLYLERDTVRTFARWANAFTTSTHAWLFKRPGVVAEMFNAHQDEQKRAIATRFWTYVLHENHPDPDHETRELSRTLKEWASKPRVGQTQFRKQTARSGSGSIATKGNCTSSPSCTRSPRRSSSSRLHKPVGEA